jgi:PAS domain S-box-containing protein
MRTLFPLLRKRAQAAEPARYARSRLALAVVLALAGPALVALLLEGTDSNVAELALLAVIALSTWFGGPVLGGLAALCAVLTLALEFWAPLHKLTVRIDALFVFPVYFLAGVLLPHLLRKTSIARREAARLGRAHGLLLAAVGEGIVATDADGNITLANPAAARMLGYTPAEMLGRNAHSLYHHSHADGSPREGRLPSADSDGARVEGEVLWRRDGTSFPVAYTQTPLTEDGSSAVGTVLVFRDISRRVQRDAALRESEELFRAVFEGSPIGISLTDPDGTLADVNAAYAEMLGSSPEALRGRNLADFTHPDDLEANLARLATAFQGKSSRAQFRKRYVRDDGTILWANVAPALIRDADGQPSLGLAMVEDITDRLRAETALRESEQRFRELVQAIPEVFFVNHVGNEPRILYVSPAYERIWGRSCQSLYADPGSWLAAVHPGDRERVLGIMAAPGNDSRDYEYRIIRPDGSVRVISAAAYFIEDEKGGVRRAGVATDITERRQLEEQVRITLENERANRQKSEFLSRVSHELRTPLNAIVGFSQLLQLARLAPDDHQKVTQIVRAGEQLLGLVTELLEISQLDAGGSTPEIEPLDLLALTESVASTLVPIADQRAVTIHHDYPAHALALANGPLLTKVVKNVVSNAINYNRPGGTVQLRISRTENTLQLDVTDTGRGVPPEHLDRLFHPFERLDAAQVGVDGSGLGLTVARTLAEAMNGAIRVHSEPGVGSTFTIEIPAARDELTPTLGPDQPTGSTLTSTTKSTVLYIEDNASNLLLVSGILELRPQVELLTATEARLGLELARQHQPRLILLDLNLPDMSGEHALAELRKDDRTSHIPVVMLSGDSTPSNITNLISAGAAEYLTKPISVPELLSIVDESLAA